MLEVVPAKKIESQEEMVPGGDLRCKGNQWIREAWCASALKKVPRENQVRMAIKKVAKKAKLCARIAHQHLNMLLLSKPLFAEARDYQEG